MATKTGREDWSEEGKKVEKFIGAQEILSRADQGENSMEKLTGTKLARKERETTERKLEWKVKEKMKKELCWSCLCPTQWEENLPRG